MEMTPNTSSASARQPALIDAPTELRKPLDIRAIDGRVVLTFSSTDPEDENTCEVTMPGQAAILLAMDLMAAAKAVQ